MRILLFGPSSMVGAALVARLRQQAQVLTLGRGGAEVTVDLESNDLVEIPGIYDAAVICTASFGGDDPPGMLLNTKVNALGTLRAAISALRVGCRHLVYLSSISAIEHADNEYFGSYGLSKRQGEENLVMACRATSADCTVLRSTQLYDAAGPGRRHQPMLYRIVEQARAGKEVIFYGQRDPLRNYLYCGDLVEMVVRVLERRITGTYPCVSPESLPLSQIASLAFRVFGTPEKIRFVANQPDIPTVYIPDGTEFYRLIDYRPQVSLASGMRMLGQGLAL